MKVLVACEESQRVCAAFRAKGAEAYSCDILPTSGNNPEWHIQADVVPLLNGNCSFQTADGAIHEIEGKWDLIIAFPPCTYFSAAGACRLFPGGQLNEERYQKGLEMKALWDAIKGADCDRIAIENPTPMKIWKLGEPSQVIQPYCFGEPYKKRTCLWLKGLPLLKPTNIITEGVVSWVSSGTYDRKGNKRTNPGLVRNQKERSKTFRGIAEAMADQWG